MIFFKGKKLEVDVYTSQIKLIENRIISMLGRLNKLEVLNIKPEPKPDVVFCGRLTNPNSYVDVIWTGGTQYSCSNIKIVFDGETGKLKSAEVL